MELVTRSFTPEVDIIKWMDTPEGHSPEVSIRLSTEGGTRQL